MSRSVEEWVGKTDDAAVPPRVKTRIIERYGNQCPKCHRFLRRGFVAFDHIIALINGGRHAENNLQPLCTVPCHEEKTADDVAIKSKIARIRANHLGVKRKKSSFPCGKNSPFKKKVTGEVVRRNP